LEGDRLTLRRNSDTIVIDAKTGRPISWQIGREGDGPKLAIELRRGEFDRRAAEIERLAADFKPAIDPMRPISDHALLLLAEGETWDRLIDHFGAARAESSDLAKNPQPIPWLLYRRLVERGAMRPLDQWWLDRCGGDPADERQANQFSLPWPKKGNEIQIPGVNNALFGFGRVMARFVFNVHCRVVPRESGPGQVGWNLGLLATGHVGEALANLDRLRSDADTGPLTCWYAARLFGFVSPRFGRPFAESGLERLDTAAFRREVETLLPTDGRCYELLQAINRAAGSLTEEDFQSLAESGMSADDLQCVRALSALARGQADETGREAVIELLAATWESHWKEQCRRDLKRLTTPPAGHGTAKTTVTLDEVLPDYLPNKGQGKNKGKGKENAPKKKDPFEHLSLDALLPSQSLKDAKQSPLPFGIQ
jgi:hypothetical protein